MIFSAALDDTNLTSIRRSIFVYAAFVFFVCTYEVSVVFDGLWFGILKVPSGQAITTSMLTMVAAVVQLYLLVRLIVTKPIAYGKLQKAWGEDEIMNDGKFKDLVASVKTMVKSSKDVEYPGGSFNSEEIENLKEIHKGCEALQPEFQRLGVYREDFSAQIDRLTKSVEEANRTYKEVLKKFDSTRPVRAPMLTAPKLHSGQFPADSDSNITFENADFRFGPELKFASEQIQKQLENMQLGKMQNNEIEAKHGMTRLVVTTGNLVKQIDDFREHADYCISFPKKFEQSDLSLAVEDVSSSLVKLKRRREWEFLGFEYVLPVCVAGVSIVPGALALFGYSASATFLGGVERIGSALSWFAWA